MGLRSSLCEVYLYSLPQIQVLGQVVFFWFFQTSDYNGFFAGTPGLRGYPFGVAATFFATTR
jgi:hypothetical protein